MKVLIVSSEVAPFAKTGGLADVSASITRFLRRQGHDARILMPLYERVRRGGWELRQHPVLRNMHLRLDGRSFDVSVYTASLPDSDAEVMMLDCPELYARPDVYTSDIDEPVRFGLLGRATLEICQWQQWGPDVIHCNDWHTGLIPLYLRTVYAWDRLFARTKTLLTIHNIGYQGVFSADAVGELGLEPHRQLLFQDDLSAGVLNFLKTGVMYADALTTVSETYAREIQTAELGMGLQELLRARRNSLFGIVNGVDYGEWNPETDPRIARNYSVADPSGKLENKRHLLEDFNLSIDSGAPLFGVVSRLTAQKGFELLMDVMPVLLRDEDVRLVALGTGEEKYEQYFQWLRDTHPSKAAFYRGYNDDLAHRVEAGADMFLMPSRYEPCGLNQMYSLRYGTVPIVRRTGGLADTVEPFDPGTGRGTGFVFDDFSGDALLGTIRHALSVYRDPRAWTRLVRNGMSRDFSWDRQGRLYVELYERLLGGRVT